MTVFWPRPVFLRNRSTFFLMTLYKYNGSC